MRNLLLFHARLSLQFVQVSTLAGIFVQAAEEVSDHIIPPHVGFFVGSTCFDSIVGEVARMRTGNLELLAVTCEENF